MENALQKLPANQIEAYDEVLTRIRAAGSSTSDTANQTLTWIFHAARPLQMDELLEALCVKEWQLDIDRNRKFNAADIVQMCQSLVVYEESSGIVRFIHPTVQEFLKSLKLPVIDLAKTCLTYLEHNAFNDICANKESMETRVQTYKLCLYAAKFWGSHTRGETETLACIEQAVFRLLASENKRDSILQMIEYANSTWGELSFVKGQSLLHIIAQNGLATICKHVLKEKVKQELYITDSYRG
jgi:hypothetical protein